MQLYFESGKSADTVEAAREHCGKQGMVLASIRDAKDAYELGSENCQCGWVSNGAYGKNSTISLTEHGQQLAMICVFYSTLSRLTQRHVSNKLPLSRESS